MTTADDIARSLDTVGLAAWFGGSLMGAAALRGGGRTRDQLEVEHDVWKRWSPVQTAAVGAHLLGSAKLATTNKGRLLSQRGVAKVSILKTLCTAGALGATFYASRLGSDIHRELRSGSATPEHGEGGALTPELESKVQRLRAVQAAVPLLTGAMLVADSRLGEQQRPMEVLRGVAARAVPDALHSLPEVLHVAPVVGAAEELAHHLPDAVRSLPDAVRALPDSAKHLPGAARQLASR